MLISILTPTKNRATTFLPDLIDSIADQTIPSDWHLEHIICDDGSSSEQLAALHEIPSRTPITTKLVYSNYTGPAGAHNVAARASSGEVLIDIDDDDVLTPDSIRKRVEHLLGCKELWSAGNAYVVSESLVPQLHKTLIRSWDHAGLSDTELMQAMLDNKAWLWAGTRTYKREALFDEDGILREWDESFPVASDLDHWLRLTYEVGKPAYIDEFLVYWREKQDSLAINAQRSGLQAEMIAQIRQKWSTPITARKPAVR